MDVRDHLGRSTFDALPAREDVLEEIQIFRGVNRGDRSEPKGAWTLDLAGGSPGARQQPLDALGLLRVWLRRAARQKGLRIVELLFLGEKSLHALPLVNVPPGGQSAAARFRNASP